ncbi:MAG: chorismate-binding protein [Mariprofundaceae bacterium]|nr:chorismate-binding protein [Mariprofundaceae bacterium]
MEDPDGSGKQHLVSRAGKRRCIQASDHQSGVKFLAEWSGDIENQEIHDSPCIRQLFYAAYEAVGLIENLPRAVSKAPVCILWRLSPEWSLCFSSNHIHLAATDDAGLDAIEAMLDACPSMLESSKKNTDSDMDYSPQHECKKTAGERYKEQVRKLKSWIAAGDVFQANIARFWSMPYPESGLESLYGRLRRVNPAPFSCYVRVGDDKEEMHILSASPERLFRIDADGGIDTRPIAGTRRRGEGEGDTALRDEMLLSDKERAEHIMLVDLERNDLGRVCIPGSVEVNESMVVEAYATVQHIVSNVRGRLREGLNLVDVFRAMFPGGTITGCPKVRCMEIIHQMEQRARGPYTGGIGFIACDGSADMNILIRSFWHHAGELHWAAGAGIVADSDPDHELIETEHKAEGLLRALL